MTIKGRLVSSTAIDKCFQTENNQSPRVEWQAALPIRMSQLYVVLEIVLMGYKAEKNVWWYLYPFRGRLIPACDGQTTDIAARRRAVNNHSNKFTDIYNAYIVNINSWIQGVGRHR